MHYHIVDFTGFSVHSLVICPFIRADHISELMALKTKMHKLNRALGSNHLGFLSLLCFLLIEVVLVY